MRFPAVGYIRRSNADSRKVKVSISKALFEQCETYKTASGEEFVNLFITQQFLNEMLAGNRSMTTLTYPEVEA